MTSRTMVLFLAVGSLLGCMSDGGDRASQTGKLSGAGETAEARLAAVDGSGVTGYVIFRQADDGVRVTATVNDLAPGKHGFHIHENGKCAGPGAEGAGGHFNPRENRHGSPEDPRDRHHAGDLGNLVADETGKGSLDQTFGFLALNGSESIIGRSVIVHSGEDDLSSQPSGSAGNRVACGVIVTVED